MGITLTTNTAYNDGCTYDDCLIASFLKSLFSKIHGAKSGNNYTISKHVKNVKADLAALADNAETELSYDYLNAMEKALPGIAFRYVVIYKNDKPLLLAYYQLHTITSQNFNPTHHKGFVKGIIRFLLDLKKAKVLITGNALRSETAGFVYDKRTLTYAQAIEGIVAGAEKIAADECTAAVILQDVLSSPFLAEKGYRQPFDDRAMTLNMDPDWYNLQDYLADLSRKYKTRANKTLEAASALTITTLTEKQLTAHQAAMNSLFAGLTQQQAFVLAQPADTYFVALKKLYKESFEVTAFFEGTKLLAFYSAFITADEYEVHYVGFDYTANTQYQLYFNILLSALERSILLRKKSLKLGRTSFDAKASLGAQPYSLNYQIKMGHIPGLVLQKFVDYFSSIEDNRWKQRSPLIAKNVATH